MKLIVTGATGYVATEVIRQALRHEKITSVIAVSRRPVALKDYYPDQKIPEHSPQNGDKQASGRGGLSGSEKLRSVVVKDYGTYPPEVRKEFQDAGACIWTVAITPSKSKVYSWDEVRKVCYDWTLAGLQAVREANASGTNGGDEHKKGPLRFLYMSGISAERDQSKKAGYYSDLSHLRGETESAVIASTQQSTSSSSSAPNTTPTLAVHIVKPGFIPPPASQLSLTVEGASYLWRICMGTGLRWAGIVPSISRDEMALSMLRLALNEGGVADILGDTIMHDPLVELAKESSGT